MSLREEYPIGTPVQTKEPRLLLKGQTVRYGVIAGFSKEPGCLRIRWEGWQDSSTSSYPHEWIEHREVPSGSSWGWIK